MARLRSILVVVGCLAVLGWVGLRVRLLLTPAPATKLPAPNLARDLVTDANPTR